MDPALLWLRWRLAAAALNQPLAWELPRAKGVALKRKRRSHFPTQGHKHLLLRFLPSVVWFSPSHLGLWPLWVHFFTWCEVRSPCPSFAGRYPVAPGLFAEKAIFPSIESSWHLVENQPTTKRRIYFWILILTSLPAPRHTPDGHSSAGSSENGQCEAPNLALFHDYFVGSGLLVFTGEREDWLADFCRKPAGAPTGTARMRTSGWGGPAGGPVSAPAEGCPPVWTWPHGLS